MNLFLLMLLAAAASPIKNKHRSRVKQRNSLTKEAHSNYHQPEPLQDIKSLSLEAPACVPCPDTLFSMHLLKEVVDGLIEQGVSGKHVIERVIEAVDNHQSTVQPLPYRRLTAITNQRLATDKVNQGPPRQAVDHPVDTGKQDRLGGPAVEQTGLFDVQTVDRLDQMYQSKTMEHKPVKDSSGETFGEDHVTTGSEDKSIGSMLADLDTGDDLDTDVRPHGVELDSGVGQFTDIVNRPHLVDLGMDIEHLAELNDELQSQLHQERQPIFDTKDRHKAGLSGTSVSKVTLNKESLPEALEMLQLPNTRSHGLMSSGIQAYFPSVQVKVMHPYSERTFKITIGLMPLMGVNDAFQQAYLDYSYRFPGKLNPFDVQLLRLKPKGCYYVKKVAAVNSVSNVQWLIKVLNRQNQPIYQDVCIPSKADVVLQSGDVILLSPRD